MQLERVSVNWKKSQKKLFRIKQGETKGWKIQGESDEEEENTMNFNMCVTGVSKKREEKERDTSNIKKHKGLRVVCAPVTPALRRLRQDDCELEVNPAYLVRSRPAWAA
jgi:hypothetical protein